MRMSDWLLQAYCSNDRSWPGDEMAMLVLSSTKLAGVIGPRGASALALTAAQAMERQTHTQQCIDLSAENEPQ
jgi:hypothetical protein